MRFSPNLRKNLKGIFIRFSNHAILILLCWLLDPAFFLGNSNETERRNFMNRLSNHDESKIFYRSVFSLVLPMALQNLINVAVTSADVIMLGKVGETALSASSLAGQVQFIMTLIFFGITSGAAVLTAQYWGKKDVATIEKVMGIAFRFAIVVAAVFTVAAFLFPRQVMLVFTSDGAVITEGVKYLRIIAVSYLFTSVTMVYLNIMRSVERVIISTVVYLISLLVNICINSLLIFGLWGFPKMGIEGAAVGTVIARLTELIITIIYAKKYNKDIKLEFRAIFVRDPLLFRDFLRYSIPVILNELMWGLGCSMHSVIIGHLGTSMVAANSVAQVTRQLATVVSFGIANAAAIMLGKSIGAGNPNLADRDSKRFIKITLIAGLCGAIIILAIRPIIINVLTLGSTAKEYLSVMMIVMSYFAFAQAYNCTMVVGIFRSGGDTRFGLILDVSTMWVCSILLGAVCAFVLKWNVLLVYVVLMSDEIIKIPLSAWRYRTKRWLKNVTR